MHTKSIGIRREDKNQWERRTPLKPSVVAELVKDPNVRVCVEPAPTRAFSDDEYRAAGATLTDDLSDCNLVMGIKEIPAAKLQQGGAYLFFSHTIKGQDYNMPLLRRLMELGCTLIDYERIVDDENRRLVFFGRHAGLAGMIDTLWAYGLRLASLGIPTPFLDIEPAHTYANLGEAEAAVAAVGQAIDEQGLPQLILGPTICGFAGYGNVSQGAQHIWDLLPSIEIEPDHLKTLVKDVEAPANRVYKVVFHEKDLVQSKIRGKTFELQDYYDHPEFYHSQFEQHARYLNILINAIYWTEDYPRLLPLTTLRFWRSGHEKSRLRVIGDISCDIGGAIECTAKATTPDNPVFIWDTWTEEVRDGVEGPGLVVMAVDNLPCELPLEASESFSEALAPFAADLAGADFSVPYADLALPGPLKRATILLRGELTPDYEYMKEFLKS